MNKPYVIYGIVESEMLVYVGITRDFDKRLRSHQISGKFPSTVSGFIIESTETKKQALAREKEIISCLRPSENDQHNPAIEGRIISWKNPQTDELHRVQLKEGMLHPDRALAHWYNIDAVGLPNSKILLLIGWKAGLAKKVFGDRSAWRWSDENKKKWHPVFKDR